MSDLRPPEEPKQNPLLHHIYDDIEEHDNRLPNWWLVMLWSTLLFGVGYWFYYQVFELGPKQLDSYKAEVAAIVPKEKPKPSGEEELLALVNDAALVEEGSKAFTATCAACHGAQGQGLIGPNLTDKYWLHGSKPSDIMKVIDAGVLDKGMPAWGKALGDTKVRQLTAFVLTQRGKEVPGKEPQGEAAP
jgi:cytochrome c oxidase cbb3-type subunit 3